MKSVSVALVALATSVLSQIPVGQCKFVYYYIGLFERKYFLIFICFFHHLFFILTGVQVPPGTSAGPAGLYWGHADTTAGCMILNGLDAATNANTTYMYDVMR